MTNYQNEIMDLLHGDTPKQKYEHLKEIIATPSPKNANEIHSFLLVNAMRLLSEEKRTALIKDLLGMTPTALVSLYGKGVAAIMVKRELQKTKHGRTLNHDVEVNKNSELKYAAVATLLANDPLFEDYYPKSWDSIYKEQIKNTGALGQLQNAGALIAAEIDRLKATEE